MKGFETVIGLEVHVELLTRHKIFCSCRNSFERVRDQNSCEICKGLPGAIPVFNRECIRPAVSLGCVLNCKIAPVSRFDRKNYFYPDLPKGYQITQFYEPVCLEGHIDLPSSSKRIRIREVHLEDDAAKLTYDGDAVSVDYNRCGVPLAEIVTMPDFSCSDEVVEFLELIRRDIKAAGVSDCKIEQGSMRIDVNLSVRRPGEEPGIRTEMKNLASFKAVAKAIAYEAERQCKVISEGGKVARETRRWNEEKGITELMRRKEDADDYKYFPEPDLEALLIDEKTVAEIRKEIPELPSQKKRRYIEVMGLKEEAADLISSDDDLSRLFEESIKIFNAPLETSAHFSKIKKFVKDGRGEIPASCLASVVRMQKENMINSKIASDLLELCGDGISDPEAYAREHDLFLITDENRIKEAIDKVLGDPLNVRAVEEIMAGKDKAKAYLKGKVIAELKGKALPEVLNRLFENKFIRN